VRGRIFGGDAKASPFWLFRPTIGTEAYIMLFPSKFHRSAAVFLLVISAALPPATVLVWAQNNGADSKNAEDPWSKAQVLQPADFAGELGNAKGESAPTIVYVGFRTLFEGGHVSAASFHGTASTEKGIAELKKWIATLPRTTNLVIYCGCCPFDRCPNIRPAYTALQDMGFTHVRVLVLPTSFAVDWVEKGYPMQKGL
jgi:thiosulfate/3-mercaptopyruvate sulfurtransferase